MVDVKETKLNQNTQQLEVIDRFLGSGYDLKKKKKELCKRDIVTLAVNYKQDPTGIKRIIKATPTIGRVTYKNLIEFLSSEG